LKVYEGSIATYQGLPFRGLKTKNIIYSRFA